MFHNRFLGSILDCRSLLQGSAISLPVVAGFRLLLFFAVFQCLSLIQSSSSYGDVQGTGPFSIGSFSARTKMLDKSPDIQRILNRGKLIVAMYGTDMPPFFMHTKSGEFIGFDVELARDIAKEFGVKVEFYRDCPTFNSVVDAVVDRKADLAISKLSKTPERAKRVLYTELYHRLEQVLLVNRLLEAKLNGGNDIFARLNDSSVQLAMAGGTAFVGFARSDFPEAKLRPYKDRWKMLSDLVKGNLHAALLDESTVQNWFHDNPQNGIRVRTVVREG